MWMTKIFHEKFLSNWVDCASHQDCISPKGASVSGCDLNNIYLPGYKGEYAGCHCYDYSTLNLSRIWSGELEEPVAFKTKERPHSNVDSRAFCNTLLPDQVMSLTTTMKKIHLFAHNCVIV